MMDWEEILNRVKEGELSVSEAMHRISREKTLDIGYASIDMDRERRNGSPEVIYGAGKTADQIIGILKAMHAHGVKSILTTRIDGDKGAAVAAAMGEAFVYHAAAQIGIYGPIKAPDGKGQIAIVTGGTSDIPVAEEAALTAEYLGNEVIRFYDMGVAGIHRLLEHQQEIAEARVIIAVAGMEGALASVVGGLVSVPVIAVPTSVGYGASLGGLSALLSMLNSCASGVSVVNIDNGFGAAFQASLINHL